MPLIDPSIVAKELEKPIVVDREIRLMYGLAPTGSETASYYSDAEKTLIKAEAERIYAELITGKEKTGAFCLTVGGPGSGKTTLVRQMQESGGALENHIHTDPDEVVMTQLKPYLQDAKSPVESDITRAVAYTYWRAASNYINNTIINRLVDEGYGIAMGTTATSPAIVETYKKLHALGRTVKAIICHADENVRLASVAKRFAQDRRYTPLDDVKAKGNVMLPDIMETHFSNADSLDIYWRGTVESGPVLAAVATDGKITVIDQNALDSFAAELSLRKPGLTWQNLKSAYESRFPAAPVKKLSAPSL